MVILALGLSILRAGTASADVTTGNLLTNPGAETGDLTGWTIGGTSNPTVDGGTFDPGIKPHAGSFDFRGGTGASGSLSQTITLVGNSGITAAAIDAGTTTANVSFWEQGLAQGTPSDDAQITVTFLSGSSTVLSTLTTPELDSHNGTWSEGSGSFAILAGTRSIVYEMDFIRHTGNDLDAFVDDNSLTVTTSTAAVPEPAGLALFGLGLVGVAGYARRRGRTR